MTPTYFINFKVNYRHQYTFNTSVSILLEFIVCLGFVFFKPLEVKFTAVKYTALKCTSLSFVRYVHLSNPNPQQDTEP